MDVDSVGAGVGFGGCLVEAPWTPGLAAEQNMRCHPPTLATTSTYKPEYSTTMKVHTNTHNGNEPFGVGGDVGGVGVVVGGYGAHCVAVAMPRGFAVDMAAIDVCIGVCSSTTYAYVAGQC